MNIIQRLRLYNKTIWLLAGAASGAVSAMLFSPGWIFGITISFLIFFYSKNRSVWRSILLIGMSEMAFYIAFQTASRTARFLSYNGQGQSFKLIPAGFLAGAIGAAILGGSVYLLYPIEARWRFAIKIIGYGALFGTLLFFIFGFGETTNRFIGHSFLYVPWQAAVAYCLSLFYARVQENHTKLPSQEQL